MPTPLVSCLMVTQQGRLPLAKQAIACFAAQTYAEKELVVVCEGDDTYVDEMAADLEKMAAAGHASIFLRASRGLTLGALRNISVEIATGAVVVQWDDDDLYHPARIAIQLAPISAGAVASCLVDQFYYFADTGSVSWVDWSRASTLRPLIPGTIMVRADVGKRARYPESGARCSRGEDDTYLDSVIALGEVAGIHDQGWCYLRRYHGSNTWDRGHFTWTSRMLSRPSGIIADPRATQALLAYAVPFREII